jgi:hypothetical protein
VNDIQMFAFEDHFVATLRCVPMAVRFKLDTCRVKLTLRQWSRFTQEDRHDLLVAPCETVAEIEAYRVALADLVALRAGENARPLTIPPCGQWERAYRPAPAVVAYARSLGVRPPDRGQWARLTRLQRFALIKLTRDNHDNVNFLPAMREFGLLEARIAA